VDHAGKADGVPPNPGNSGAVFKRLRTKTPVLTQPVRSTPLEPTSAPTGKAPIPSQVVNPLEQLNLVVFWFDMLKSFFK